MNTALTREINTPEVRQAIAAVLHDHVKNEAEATAAAGHVFVILDRASAGLPVDGDA